MTTFPIMLFAAGLGTRMAHLTQDRPKPLVQVAGKSLLNHALALTDTPEIRRRVVNIHYKAQMIRDYLAGQDIALSDESGVLLETGGGLRKARPLLGSGAVMTLNTDVIWAGANPIPQLGKAWRDDMDALLMLIPPARARGHKGHGDFAMDKDGRLTRGSGFVYSGLQIMRTNDLGQIAHDAFTLNVVWDRMIARKGVYGMVYDGEWCDVGYPAAIPMAEDMLRNV